MKRMFLVILLLALICGGCSESNSESNSNLTQIIGVVVDVNVYPSQTLLASPITSIEFRDGRILYFRGIYYGDKYLLQKGKCYVITYSKWDKGINCVEKCNPK